MNDHRRFIRHPSTIPIEFSSSDGIEAEQGETHDVSLGGLSFESHSCPEQGSVVEVRIPAVEPSFATQGRVVWCRSRDSKYEVGIEFLDAADAFRARMVEQVCHIEEYRRDVREHEGRELSSDAAAREWITRFAANFPNPARKAG